jgi:steroid delta-isomerase-like uncharacterized protein
MENQNEALTRQLHDSFSADQFSDCLAMAADDVRINAYAFNMNFNGKQEFLGFMQGFKQAFPDMKIRYRNVISQDNKVAVEFTAAGTHTGPLQTPAGSIPPTGKSVELDVVELLEWDNGKLKSIHNYQDAGSLMRQIGAM